MKWIHTADWHLGKLVQGVHMTEDQRYVLEQLLQAIVEERPDAVIIAGDLYDRAVPPTEAVELLSETLQRIIVDLHTPVLAIAGNHDSPDRLDFAAKIMEQRGLHLAGRLRRELEPVVLHDEAGEVHFHLIPYADPAQARHVLDDDSIRTHDDMMRAIISRLEERMSRQARHVLIGHAFVTPHGEPQDNTSDSERPLAIGGAEHVRAEWFRPFHYVALGHLHQAHYVGSETIRYAGSPLKYSISEENHRKGFYVVEMDASGGIQVDKRLFSPLRDMRRVKATMEELLTHPVNEDYVFVTLLNEHPVLYPMEKVRTVYPNALHVERRPPAAVAADSQESELPRARREADPAALFAAFYEEVQGRPPGEAQQALLIETWNELLRAEGDGA
ncbi:exonuclease SbcCD subunit D [Xylanibacillus composti]|uniref:Nuclease SbcCD subunit D n=1 Tax=Xylanibacillus composti TaxID=1572762 RepID=A0A8J4H0N6_9BACL|nr:exonuclease SbcCD subunit D [Xylanibacillus composti]MDT9726777.1 exonuclease SbcCD subunit D [Xylanibacillus composti]GIQ67241.1 nuclease SbcCD subunit D [Xylanibacillus composti]